MSEDRRKHRVPQVGPRDVAGEANAEIESHLAMRVADLVADGWEPGAARAEALRRFGDPARVKSEMVTIDRSREISMRRSRYFADLGQDVRVAARQLRKRPFFATVVVTVIALGIGATAAVFAVVDGALLRPLPFAAGDRLVYLWDGQRTDDRINASFPEFRDWQREADFLKSIMGVFGNAVTLQTRAGSELLIAAWVAGDPSGTVGMRPLLGRWFTPDEMRTTARVAMLA
jgi:putative ABC transport system permease protein